ncbi:hypothetical protein B0H15DRAFT_945740 [Mycena belliarum]|uniref:DUF6535 domain-containing protein n=1 Tax=Mycena belliarum TaxID=1033014 RepID=A0AAD6UAE7_9AGAR|nr:hypothetical protein B0H15DRAFT_945740 [Mycena belliae]
MRAQEQQIESLSYAIEKLQQTPPKADKKAVFWKHYQTLADEHDQELLQRSGTDLDTSLIFAGLFSAVSSAFIIQIEQQIQEGTQLLIIVSQCLLVFSLFSTLLAALLAVLGKQWLMYYSAAGERGTIESRGLERQRKFDGLQRWRFTTVMHLFPLLLQLSLLLFAIALSVYFWTVHIALAVIVLVSTSAGVLAYIFLLMTSLVAPDSPFQNPLTPFLKTVLPLSLMGRAKDYIGRRKIQARRISARGSAYFSACLREPFQLPYSSAPMPHPPDPLPQEDTDIIPGAFPPPAAEAPAVVWVLETSTDPLVLAAAADVAVDLQWPSGTDLTVPLTRLRDAFIACFVTGTVGATNSGRGKGLHVPLKSVRPGMTSRAITYGRAYSVLRLAHKGGDEAALEVANLHEPAFFFSYSELDHMILILEGKPSLAVRPAGDVVRWALRVIPSLCRKSRENLHQFLQDFHPDKKFLHLDAAGFAEYLFCVNSFFGSMNPLYMGLVDKSKMKDALMLRLVEALCARLRPEKLDWEMPDLVHLLRTTASLSIRFESAEWWYDDEKCNARKVALYKLCGLLAQHAGSEDAILAATQLARIEISSLNFVHGLSDRGDVDALGDMLWWMVFSRRFFTCQVIQSLICPTRPSWRFCAPFLVQDPQLWPAIEYSSLWIEMGRVAVEGTDSMCAAYIDLGYTLAQIPAWDADLLEKLINVLATCSAADNPSSTRSENLNAHDNMATAALVALTSVWSTFHLSKSLQEFFPLLRCTCTVALLKARPDTRPLVKTDFLVALGTSLLSAAEPETSFDQTSPVGMLLPKAIDSLRHLAHTILTGSHEQQVDLQNRFPHLIDKLEREFANLKKKKFLHLNPVVEEYNSFVDHSA